MSSSYSGTVTPTSASSFGLERMSFLTLRPYVRKAPGTKVFALALNDIGINPVTSTQDTDRCVIASDSVIWLAPLDILITVLDGCDTHNDEEGKDN